MKLVPMLLEVMRSADRLRHITGHSAHLSTHNS